MPYCEKCGSQISENASFCHSCGARVIGEVEINDACVSDENTYQEDEIPSRKIGEVYKYNVAAIGGILTACTTLYISIDVIIKQINASQHKYWYPREGTYTTPGYNPGTITFNVILSIIAVIILVISIKSSALNVDMPSARIVTKQQLFHTMCKAVTAMSAVRK